jgi:pyruvate/2-oxoglutarate dehydrogenase complex dihydrolipoamide acyltransferase (E2) component
MDTFLIDVPMPAMGATVNELTVVGLKVKAGDRVAKGQKIAELESDKSVFEFESPADGVVKSIFAQAGDVKDSGTPFVRLETMDTSLKHLEAKEGARPAGAPGPAADSLTTSASVPGGHAPPRIWTPRAIKLAQEAGMDPVKITEIEATGPGNRVSGDDFTRYLAKLKTGS